MKTIEEKLKELERRITVLEQYNREEDELIAAAFELPPPDRKTYSRAEVESYGKLRR